eukprot:m.32567 g.32567  ORF g.32567 m.32567 type:complete len:472 (+) comp9402_c0_seq2:1355-2770(+)
MVKIRVLAGPRHAVGIPLGFIVEIECPQIIHTRALDIALIGRETRTLVKASAHEMKKDPVSHVFFETHQSVLGAPWAQRGEVGPLELTQGKHQFTVELDLPDTMTPSGKCQGRPGPPRKWGEGGEVGYVIRASLDRAQSAHTFTTVVAEEALEIVSCDVPHTQLESLIEPSELAVEAQDSLVFSTGNFVLHASMQHKLLFSGETYPLRIRVQNNSPHNVKLVSGYLSQDNILSHDMAIHEGWPPTPLARNLPRNFVHDESFAFTIPRITHCSFKGHFYQVKFAVVVEASLEGWGQRRIAVAMPVRIVHRPPHPPRPETTQSLAFGAAPSSPAPARAKTSRARPAGSEGADKRTSGSEDGGGAEGDSPPFSHDADAIADDLSSVSLSPGPRAPRVRSESTTGAAPGPDAVENLPAWMPDEEVSACCVCRRKFTLFLRRHHCRVCGRVVCAYCGPIRGPRNIRICPTCNGTVS